jgi:hypothetical protein
MDVAVVEEEIEPLNRLRVEAMKPSLLRREPVLLRFNPLTLERLNVAPCPN